MALAQRHFALKPNANGMLAPLCRAATHIGYLIGVAEASQDENWPAKAEEVAKELEETLAHMDEGLTPNHTAFLGEATAALYVALKADMVTVKDEPPQTKDDAMRQFQILNANIAYTAAQYERALIGADVDEGTNA